MMVEGAGEVKREAVKTGAGGRPTGAQEPAGEEVAQQCSAECNCQGDGGCSALQARSNSTGER